MKKIAQLISILALLLTQVSCTDTIDIDLPEGKPKLVVQAWFKVGIDSQIVQLAKTTQFAEKGNANTPETGATIKVICNDGNEYALTEIGLGKYAIDSTKFKLEVGKKYTLSIFTKDGKQYASEEQTVRKVPLIEGKLFLNSEIVTQFSLFPLQSKGYYVSIQYTEQLGKGDSYFWKMYRNGKDLSVGNNAVFRDDVFLEDGALVPYRLATFNDTLVLGDTLTIQQMSINENVFDYFVQLQNQQNGGTPFSTPPAPVEGNLFNIKDGDELVLGTFIVSDNSSFTEILTVDNVEDDLTPELIQKLQLDE